MLLELLGKVPDRWLFNYAHAVLDSHGLERSKRVRFAVLVSLLSLTAAFRWNHSVSVNMLTTTYRWVGGSIHTTVKQAFQT